MASAALPAELWSVEDIEPEEITLPGSTTEKKYSKICTPDGGMSGSTELTSPSVRSLDTITNDGGETAPLTMDAATRSQTLTALGGLSPAGSSLGGGDENASASFAGKKRKGSAVHIGRRVKVAYDTVCAWAFVAVALMVADVEITTTRIIDTDGVNEGRIGQTSLMTGLKVAILVAIVCQTVAYIWYQQLLYSLMLLRGGAQSWHAHRWRRRAKILLELCLCCFHVPFWVDYSFHMETFRDLSGYSGPWPFDGGKVMIPYHVDMLSMFMVNRVYLLPRLVLYHSSLWSQGSALATLANMEISVGVSIRAGFANNPGNYLFFFLMSPFMLLTFVFSNCERLVDPLYTGYHHSGWASFISLTTVGYGTDEAQTHCGRGVSTILIILGITGTSLLISKVQDALHMTPQQQTVMRMIAEKRRQTEIVLLSALAIQKVWRLFQKERKEKQKREDAASRGRRPSIVDLGRGSRGPIDLTKSPAVYASLKALDTCRKMPLVFEADFSTAMNLELNQLKETIQTMRTDQVEMHRSLQHEIVQVQSHLLNTMLHEFRQLQIGMNEDRGEKSPGGRSEERLRGEALRRGSEERL